MNHFCISVTQRLRNRSNKVSLFTNAADGLVHVGPGFIRAFREMRPALPEASLNGLMPKNQPTSVEKEDNLYFRLPQLR